MIILKPGSHAFRLLLLLLHVGEFPYCSLGILGDTRSVKYVVNRMAEIHDVNLYNGQTVFHGRLVNVSGRGKLKTIRLNAYALNELSYRAVYWLDGDLTPKRWLEFLDRCTEEAARGFSMIGN